MSEEETLEEKVKRLEQEISDLKTKLKRCVLKEEETEAGEIATAFPAEEETTEAEESAETEE